MFKKLISVFLTVFMIAGALTVAPLSVSAETFKSGDYEYKLLSNNTVEITKYTGTASQLTIPGKLDNYNVSSIGNYAFFTCSSLKSVTISSGVESIDSHAFSDCKNLTSIIIPSGVRTIGDNAFRECSSLTKITIPDTVSNIAMETFYYCTSLKEVILPDSITSIAVSAFFVCESLEKIKIPSQVNEISYGLFCGCSSLKEITIPDKVKEIREYAFSGCSSLKEINIPENLTSIAYDAFEDCEKLEQINVVDSNKKFCSVDGNLYNKKKTELVRYSPGKGEKSFQVPDAVEKIAGYAFNASKKLTSVIISDRVTSIDEGAFTDCSSLESVSFGKGLKYCFYAFDNCEKLTRINVSDLKSWCNIDFRGSCPFSSNTTKPNEKRDLYHNNKLVKNLKIPKGVKHINEKAFRGCKSITSLSVPDSVTSIREEAFAFCDNLKTIKVSDKLRSIHVNAFYNTAWFNNQKKGLTYIGKVAYKYKSKKGKIPYYQANIKCPSTVKIKKGTKIIAQEAFKHCRNLKKIVIPDSVIRIGTEAFCESGLEKIKLGNNVNDISPYAFYDCNCKEITIPTSVKKIESFALGYESELRNDGDGDGDYETEVPIEGFKMKCYKGTVGEKYAKKCGFKVKYLSSIKLKAGSKSSIALASSKKAKFKSSSKSVVKVSSKGKITARKKGKAKITVKQGNKKYKYTVIVK